MIFVGRLLTVCCGVGLFLSACSHNVTITAPILDPVIAQSPQSVLVSFDSSIADHHCVVSKGYIADEWLIELGVPTIAAFKPAFSAMFADVEFVPSDAGIEASNEVDVIRLSLNNYTGCELTWPIVNQPVGITFSANIYQGSAKELSNWTGSGTGFPEDLLIHKTGRMDSSEYLAYMTSLAIRRALAEFLWNFEESEMIRAWKESARSQSGVE